MPDPSESTLDPEIRTASSPSLAASMRLTEQARKQLAAGSTDDAIRTLARAVSIDPGNPFQYFYLGRGYMVKKNYGQAITFLKRAEIGFGSRPQWYGATLSYEGACYEVMGKTVEAAHAYQHAFAAAPNNLMARVGYSRLAPLIAPPAPDDASASADQARAGAPSGAVQPAPIQPTPAPAAPEDNE
jgi:tetratricopeptide (TPR) repeat protein